MTHATFVNIELKSCGTLPLLNSIKDNLCNLTSLCTDFFETCIQIIISEEEAHTITGEKEPSEEEPSDIDSDAGKFLLLFY